MLTPITAQCFKCFFTHAPELVNGCFSSLLQFLRNNSIAILNYFLFVIMERLKIKCEKNAIC